MTAPRNPLATRLKRMGACEEAIAWVRDCGHTTMQAAWDACERADWMLWLIEALDGEPRSPRLRLAACACARTALRYVPEGEDRPRLAIETAERHARGEATDAELAAAWDAAWDAVRAAARAAAWAAAWAARAAARAAASDAARAASDAAWAAAWAAWDAALREMAALVRGVIPIPEAKP